MQRPAQWAFLCPFCGQIFFNMNYNTQSKVCNSPLYSCHKNPNKNYMHLKIKCRLLREGAQILLFW